MTNTAEQVRTLPLVATHAHLGALMIERDGWRVPASYGDVRSEYEAVRTGAGLVDLSSRGRILVSGTEAIQFLNGLITNDMKTLAAGSWMPAVFPNVQGRLIASVRVVRVDNEENQPVFLLDTEAATHEGVLKTIERFTLAGDFRVIDITNETAQLSLQGNNSRDFIQSVLGETAASLKPNEATKVRWRETDVRVIASGHTPQSGFDLIVDATEAGNLWQTIQAAGTRAFGYDALEILRIEAGVPRFGIDMDETNVVSETNLDDAVNFTKGCYVGQEIIARIKYRGHVAKKLSGITFEGRAEVEAGALIKSSDDKEIGRITSVTYSPWLGSTIALGYLKYDYLTPDTPVQVSAATGDVSARVTSLPFVKADAQESRI